MNKELTLRGIVAIALAVAGSAEAQEQAASRFSDPEDGRFDVSSFLDEAYGFVPLLLPITEPAVGYGAVGAAVFIDGEPPVAGEPFVRPNITAVGAMRTENGTRGWLAAHLGTWREGRLRTTAAIADLDVNLEFFGLGGDRLPEEGLDYSVKGQGGVAGANMRIGESQLWIGLRYLAVDTSVAFEQASLPALADDNDLRLGALTPSLTIDRRDNFFTPVRGWYLDFSVPIYRDDFGSDRDFETANLTTLFYRPVAQSLFLGMRGSAKYSSDGTPFYLRPYVSLRGVQALSYQGERAVELETELRWQLGSRYSVVGFVGAGESQLSTALGDRDESVTAGGAGFRYLVARRYGLHLGVDVAGGAGDTVIYVIFGNAWLRP